MKKLFKFSDSIHGPGSIYFSWQKGPNAKYLVTTGLDQIVNLHDKYGNKISSFSLNGICTGLEWNKNGDLLALITDRSSVVKLWNANNQTTINLDFAVKEILNLLIWSVKSPNLLAITTSKGNLLIYDHNTSRKMPILGKHSKKIISGCWTNQNLLALVCEDRFLSISDESGDTVFMKNLKSKCNLVKSSSKPIEFTSIKQTELNQQQAILIESYCISLVLNRKQIMLLPIQALDQPCILSFEEKYEDVFDYYWQATNGTLLISFQSGFIINVQTTGNQLGQELAYVKVFSDTISSLNLCESTLAVVRKNVIKLIDTNNLEQIDSVYAVEDEQELEWLEWSANGQMLAVSSITGNLDVFLMKLPNVYCVYQTKIAYLSTLLEITFVDIYQDKDKSSQPNKIQLDIEPTVIATSNSHLVACMNNRAYFYELDAFFYGSIQSKMIDGDLDVVREKEYSGIIKSIHINDDHYVAILFTDNRSILHRLPHLDHQQSFSNDDDELDQSDSGSKKNRDYYQVDTKLTIVSIELTNSFFIWSTNTGILELFSIEEWTTVSIHRHLHPIKQIAPDFIGLHILLVDERNEAFVFDATTEQLIPVETRRKEESNDDDLDESFNYENLLTDRIVVGQRNFSETFPFQFTKLLWDLTDHSTFAVIDRKQILVYYFVSKSIQGSFVQLVGKSKLEDNMNPLIINDGYIHYQTATGAISWSQLDTHNYSKLLSTRMKNVDDQNIKMIRQKMFYNLLKLRRLEDCWLMCKTLNKIDYWLQFIDCCLHDLNINEATRIARHIGHAGIVWSLKSIQSIEEWNLLAGHLAMYLQWFDLAERLYLKSSQPTYALRLRLDLMQWNTCLVLAKRLANDQLPFIHKQQANELEFEENYSVALEHYQEALLDKLDLKNDQLDKEQANKHNQECLAGISRCLIKCNDRKKGLQIAMKLDDLDLVNRTAAVCEEQNLLNDAAQLYEKTGELENACTLYLSTRNLTKVKELINQQSTKTNKINWPTQSILVQYAKLQEQDGKFTDAFRAFEQADHQLDCVRLLLDKLNRPEEAVKLVRGNRTTEACLMIAKYFQKTSDYESAIEFLVYSGKLEEAFEMALQESQMNLYLSALLQLIHSKSSAENLTWFDLELDSQRDQNLIKQLQRVAIYYEEEHDLKNSGKFYCLAGQLRKGVQNLLKSYSIQKNSLKQEEPRTKSKDANDEDALKLAIEFVCRSNDEQSIQQVIEVLLNELDNSQTADFQYLFKLYMCSGQFREATRTALLLAKDEQTKGNYDQAHSLLVDMCKNLWSNKMKVSFELLSALHLLHCYKLAKLYLKHEKLEQSCELLCKVSNNINKFPKHAAQILSTTILECLKLGYKSQAIGFATVLLQNSNYLEQLDGKFRKKIETLIRKSASVRKESFADPQVSEEEKSVCPFCSSDLTNKFQLSCNSCRAVIPFSILSGYHLTNEDPYHCNNCYLPFTFREFEKFKETGNLCPGCGMKLENESITKLNSLALTF